MARGIELRAVKVTKRCREGLPSGLSSSVSVLAAEGDDDRSGAGGRRWIVIVVFGRRCLE